MVQSRGCSKFAPKVRYRDHRGKKTAMFFSHGNMLRLSATDSMSILILIRISMCWVPCWYVWIGIAFSANFRIVCLHFTARISIQIILNKPGYCMFLHSHFRGNEMLELELVNAVKKIAICRSHRWLPLLNSTFEYKSYHFLCWIGSFPIAQEGYSCSEKDQWYWSWWGDSGCGTPKHGTGNRLHASNHTLDIE